jgi:transposase
MKVTTIGIDVAKSVFQVHGIEEHGKVVLRRQLRRGQLLLFFSRLRPCLMGMEACASSHYWARKLAALGHTVRLMAPQFVKPYRKNDKNDGNDAEAICEAVQRPSMRFVPVKSPEQQAELAVHRVRRRLMSQRTALINTWRPLGNAPQRKANRPQEPLGGAAAQASRRQHRCRRLGRQTCAHPLGADGQRAIPVAAVSPSARANRLNLTPAIA